MNTTVKEMQDELTEMTDALEKAFQANLVMQELKYGPYKVREVLEKEGIAVPQWLLDKTA